MSGHHALCIDNLEAARHFLAATGADPRGVGYMMPKAVFRCIKLKALPSHAANIIKQEMLAKGGEAALSSASVYGRGTTDVLLMGTLKQYRLLLDKLKLQPFGLSTVAEEIEMILQSLEKKPPPLELPSGKTLSFSRGVLVMGILNITPDSFSDGGRYLNPEQARQRALQMAAEGAHIIDIGGSSSRPGSTPTEAGEEIGRVLPVIEKLAREDLILSVDTWRSEVARLALEAGADLVNDIGRLQLDAGMIAVLAHHRAPVVLMHNRLQIQPGQPYQDLIPDMINELQESIAKGRAGGLSPQQMIIDPGLGFGKTRDQNLHIIQQLTAFTGLGYPLLVGASRKSFIGSTLDLEVAERLEGSLAVAAAAVMKGAHIIRVHDVRETIRVIRMLEAISGA